MKALACSTLLLGILPVIAHPDHADAPPAAAQSSQAVKTGNGSYSFETVPGWGALPENKNIGPTHGGVAVDKAGNVYVATDAQHGICKFNKDGKFEKFFGKNFNGFHSLAIIAEGDKEYLYGANGARTHFRKMDLDGNEVLRIPNEKTGEIPGGYHAKDKDGNPRFLEDGSPYIVNPLKGITASAIAPDGTIFLACGYGSNLVHKFTKEGVHVKTFGGRSANNDRANVLKFQTCHGLAIDTRFGAPRLLVVDRENGRLMHYDFEFKFIGEHARFLRRPCAVSIRGNECAIAELAGRVTILDKRGAHVAFLGDNPNVSQRANFGVAKEAMKTGVFTAPHGLSYDNSGNIIVQDWNKNGRVTMLKHL